MKSIFARMTISSIIDTAITVCTESNIGCRLSISGRSVAAHITALIISLSICTAFRSGTVCSTCRHVVSTDISTADIIATDIVSAYISTAGRIADITASVVAVM